MSILVSQFLFPSKSPTIYIEHAHEPKQIEWGLMQRRFLEENHGMLFHFSEPQIVSFWAFNCYIDLSVAFIDEHGIVSEILPLYSYPKKMASLKPILTFDDLESISKSEPVILFFQERSITSSIPVKYVLEMNHGWFEKNHIKIGDYLHWNIESNLAIFNSSP